MPIQDCLSGRDRGRKGARGHGLRGCGAGRMPDAADLHLAMLAVLAGQPRTGLATIQALATRMYAGAPLPPSLQAWRTARGWHRPRIQYPPEQERLMTATTHDHGPDAASPPARRDFLALTAAGAAAVGAGAIAWPLVDSMNPSGDVLAMSTIEVDLAPVELGQGIIVLWRGQPVFIRHRTEDEIKLARETVVADLRDPATDSARVKPGHEQWLVVSAICTHLGCVPGGSRSNQPRGEFGGWFCPCHGSQYDTAGRIRKGPAPLNLPLVTYAFLTDRKIIIG